MFSDGDKLFIAGIIIVVFLIGGYFIYSGSPAKGTALASTAMFSGVSSGERYVAPEDTSTGLSVSSNPSTDGKVKVTSSDIASNYLNDKLLQGSNITITKNNSGGNETLSISATGTLSTNWTDLANFPSSCPAGEAVQTISAIPTCIAVGSSGIVDTNCELNNSCPNIVYGTDFNSNLTPQTCPVGQALRTLGATPTCVAVGGAGADTNCAVTHSCANVIYSNDNVSLLTNDANYQNLANMVGYAQPKGTYLSTLSGHNVSELTNDSNFQSFTNTENNYAHKGSYLASIPSGVVWDGNNVSRLVNDSNFQSFANTENNYQHKGNYLTAIIGNISLLTNDSNFQTFTNVDALFQLKGSYLTTLSGHNVSELTNDSNFQNLADMVGYAQPKGTYLSTLSGHNVSELTNDSNFQSFTAVNALFQPKGTYLTAITGNISLLTNDSNFQTFTNTENNYQHKGSYLTSIAGQNLSSATNDSNFQSLANVTGLLTPYLPKSGGTLTGSVNVNGNNLTDANSYVVKNGSSYSWIDNNGTCMVMHSGATLVYVGC